MPNSRNLVLGQSVIMNDTQTMGARLRQLRKDRGLTQVEVAAALDVSRSHITQVELGADPGFALFVQLAEFYNVPLDYLYRGLGSPFPGADKNCQPPYSAEELALIELWREMGEEQRTLILTLIEKAVRPNVA